MRNKENAYSDFIAVIKRSWTWERMTEPERAAFWRLAGIMEEAKGTYEDRMKVYHSIYTAFLYGLGYDGPEWRESKKPA